jgi:pimeloyl-ACP methyl ester carboxylesterase
METPTAHAPDGTCYSLSGPTDAHAIVLAHGVGMDLHMWDGQVSALVPGFRVLRYDMLGHGATSKSGVATGFESFTAQLHGLLRHLDLERFTLVGYSMGGIIAQRFSADHPESVARLVLMNTFYRRSPKELGGVRERLRVTEEEGLEAVAELAVRRWFAPEFQRSHPEIVESVRTRLTSNDLQGYLRAYRVFVEADDQVCDALTSVTCPALVMTGDRDSGASPEMARRMADDLHDARVVILDGLGHAAPLEGPDRVNAALLDFLCETG